MNQIPLKKFQDNDLNSYDYTLPENQIAQEPTSPRDACRLLVVHRSSGTWEHRSFKDLPSFLGSQHLIVANNTQVLKARLLGYRIRPSSEESGKWIQGGKVEFVLLEELKPRVWEGLFHASAQYRPGLCFRIPVEGAEPLTGTMVRGASESPSGTVVVEFDRDPIESGVGEIPLPHYMNRQVRPQDEKSYQTIYAKILGSAAAPTAGLHFTEKTREDLRARQVQWEEITLHVGLGTFRPVKTLELCQHVMHEERYDISPSVAKAVSAWKGQGKKILAVGTTSVRTLESAWRSSQSGAHLASALQIGSGRTSLFIRPGNGFEFKVVDHLLTNFHLPRSTLLMLVCAFAGRDLILSAYEEAVRQGYRFYSYGDAMVIL